MDTISQRPVHLKLLTVARGPIAFKFRSAESHSKKRGHPYREMHPRRANFALCVCFILARTVTSVLTCVHELMRRDVLSDGAAQAPSWSLQTSSCAVVVHGRVDVSSLSAAFL
jgi:hypothetical protein